MESTTLLIKLLLEWLSWILLFLAWAILTKSALRKYRKKHNVNFTHERITYYISMSTGLIIFIFLVLFVVDPFIGFIVAENVIDLKYSVVFFWTISIVLFFLTPSLISSLISRFSKKFPIN